MTTEPAAAATVAYEDLTPTERQWLAENPRDPRPHCPNRGQHAVVLYGQRWTQANAGLMSDHHNWPRLDGKSVRRTHKQVLCEGCLRYSIWLPREQGEIRG